MGNLFSNYMRLREQSEGVPQGVTATIKLQRKDGSREFAPFVIDKDNHPNLARIVSAFLNSDKVPIGYTTLDKNKGEVAPQLKKKSLWLTGGAVRDHLLGKTIKNFDLVTDATASEIKMILQHAGFLEAGSESGQMARSRNRFFYPTRSDKKGKPVEYVATVNGQPFHISTLSKSPKSRFAQPDEAQTATSIEEDAANRDFTINAMYIPLTNDDGPNSELIDVFGGANHLRSGELKAIGEKFDDRLKEDPGTALRALNQHSVYGDGEFPEKYMKSIKDADLSSCGKDRLRSMFVSGIEHPDCNPRKFVKLYSKAGVLGHMFPDMDVDEEMPEDMRNDRWMVTAKLLGKHNPDDVKQTLCDMGWSAPEGRDVAYLVKLNKWAANKFDPSSFNDLYDSHTGLTKNKIRDFMIVTKSHAPQVDDFLTYEAGDLMPYQKDGLGLRSVNPLYTKFLGRTPRGEEFDAVRKKLMLNRWMDMQNQDHEI